LNRSRLHDARAWGAVDQPIPSTQISRITDLSSISDEQIGEAK
jgi:hypothetical protein